MAESRDQTSPEPSVKATETGNTKQDKVFPIICVGASAGGLEAIEALVAALPADSGMAFVVITHTDPQHASMLPELIKRKTRVKVDEIQNGMRAAPDTIYIPPSDRDPLIRNDVFELERRPAKTGLHMPIDLFCKHLAAERGECCGCVILSGTGTDGTQGVRLVKEKSGLTIAQDPLSARHTGMPSSAIDTGLVDHILNPENMPERIIEFFRSAASIGPIQEGQKETDPLRRILSFLAHRTQHDFSQYKKSTLVRRIERRMAVTRCKKAADYLEVLHRDPAEPKALFQDLLIGVTSFFRDPASFDYLKDQVFPGLLRKNDGPVRVWIPGCATGEEAYSVAIIIQEALEADKQSREVQLFATDIDPRAVEKARQGVYPLNIATDVGEERLKRFFRKEGDVYYVKREIREPLVFAEQNILRDPPFSGLDLLVCRNLLIYLEPPAQNKLLPLFHYTLKDDAILFLGSSESVGRFPELFEPISKQHSIYRKKSIIIPPKVDFPTGVQRLKNHAHQGAAEQGARHEPTDQISLYNAVERLLLKHFTPACAIVNHHGEIVHIHGRTGKYLEPAQGSPSVQITEMAREGLRFSLMSALRRVREDKKQVVREPGVRVKVNGGHQRIELIVQALAQPPLKDTILLVFKDLPDMPGPDTPEEQDDHGMGVQRIEELERELMRVNQEYRSALEELETSNEELKSTNEEMHSSNEELQSTNEELESSREELQSLNEELSTVNNELHNKILALDRSYKAITHVLNSTRIAMLFLSTEMKVQRFTEKAADLINLIDTDIGRPIEHIASNLEVEQLAAKARKVLESLVGFEDEVRTKDGHWYKMSIMVHRTDDHIIEGVVLTFINIDAQKKAQLQLTGGKELSTGSV